MKTGRRNGVREHSKASAVQLAGVMSLATSCLVAHAQYKCIAPGGGVTFQQTPCVTGAHSTRLELAAPLPRDPAAVASAASRLQRDAAAADWSAAVRRAIEARLPLVGMTVDELVQAIGMPRNINFSNYGRGPEEQRIYVGSARTWYVYTRGGYVTALQDVAGGDPTLAARANCPSAQDLRNEEVSLSSPFASDRERRQVKLNETRQLCGFNR